MYSLHGMVRLLAVIKQKINGEVVCMAVEKSTRVICDRQTTKQQQQLRKKTNGVITWPCPLNVCVLLLYLELSSSFDGCIKHKPMCNLLSAYLYNNLVSEATYGSSSSNYSSRHLSLS